MVDAISQRNPFAPVSGQPPATVPGKPPIDSPKDRSDQAELASEVKSSNQQETFETFLNETSVTVLEKNRKPKEFDPVDALFSGSVYGDPGRSTPI